MGLNPWTYEPVCSQQPVLVVEVIVMAKLAPTSIKYLIRATIRAKGVIEKPDVIGAIFGQTEGLLGSDLDLRELQRTGRIGRIEVNITSNQGNSQGTITIPSSLDSAETALIAATMETIERVGPCTATIKLESVEDTRSLKRKYVIDKAKSILKNLVESSVQDSSEMAEQIKETVRTYEITEYRGLPCGPGLRDAEEMIIVEGRADILNMLRYGIKNTIAVEGTAIPDAVVELTRQKETTLLVDGDRGGQLIYKEFLQRAEIDYVATAPRGKEVEELSKKEVFKALRDKVPAEQYKMERKPDNDHSFKERPQERRFIPKQHQSVELRLRPKQKELFKKTLGELVGTRAACIFNSKNELLGKVPVSELPNTIKTVENPEFIVFDGKVNPELGYLSQKSGVSCLIGMEKEYFNTPLTILSKKDLD
jgi:DNA primase